MPSSMDGAGRASSRKIIGLTRVMLVGQFNTVSYRNRPERLQDFAQNTLD